MDSVRIGKKLKELRGDRTLREVASGVGVTVQAICNYENGARIPRDEVKKSLARYYRATVSELFFADDVHEKQTL